MAASRQKWTKMIADAQVTSPKYPKCKVAGVSPYEEQIMSMPTMITNTATEKHTSGPRRAGVFFFFIYNLNNYYHFLYDTLPYLYFYFNLHDDNVKLLLPAEHKLLPFQEQTFRALGVIDKIEYAEEGTIYETLYLASSLTHGRTDNGSWASDLPPSLEAATVWRRLSGVTVPDLSQKLYISRRSWIHGDTANIGTNYTTRRRCLNEDDVVALFERYGYRETFCELMTMDEKIAAFATATHVAGFIGGGLANLLFSGEGTRVACIETPEFLRINARFRHSMDHTQITYLPATGLAPHEGPWPLFCRVKVRATGLIGEIATWLNGKYLVKVSNNDVAGFDADANFKEECFAPDELEPLDGGLNSPFICNLNVLEKYLEEECQKT